MTYINNDKPSVLCDGTYDTNCVSLIMIKMYILWYEHSFLNLSAIVCVSYDNKHAHPVNEYSWLNKLTTYCVGVVTLYSSIPVSSDNDWIASVVR